METASVKKCVAVGTGDQPICLGEFDP